MTTRTETAASGPPRASLPRVRERNLAVVAKAIFRSDPPPSRANVAASTGLTKATTSRLVSDLLEGQIIVELDPDEGQLGRPATPLSPAPRSMVGVGLEINVAYLAGLAMDLQGTALDSFKVPYDTVGASPEQTLGRLGELASTMVEPLIDAGMRIVGARLALPGPVSGSGLLTAPNLGWRPFEPVPHLGERWLDICPATTPENDAKLQAIPVSRPRPGLFTVPVNYLYVAGDVGIGSALILDGQLTQGEHGWAGELGHVCVDPNGPLCTCGARGCLEAIAGQAAIRRMADLPEDTDIQEVIDRLTDGDTRTLEAVTTAAHALGIAVANAVNLCDVSNVVLGSGLSRLTPWLKPAVTAELNTRVLEADQRQLAVLAGPEDEVPATTGGALSVLESVLDDPARFLG